MTHPMSISQDKTWRGTPVEDMNVGHQVNTLAYIRRHARAFQDRELARAYLMGCPEEILAEFDRPAEEWVEDQLLVRRLAELTEGIGPVRRAAIKVSNKAYEIATGYKPR